MVTSCAVTTTDVRCPENPRRLFMRLHHDPDVRIDSTSNLIEVSCRDCSREAGGRVLHRYNIVGELVETDTT